MIKKNGCREIILTTVCDNRMITKYEIFTNLITDTVDLFIYHRYGCGLSQIICLNVITICALLNNSVTPYRCSHSTQFPFFLGSVQFIQFCLSFIFIFNS